MATLDDLKQKTAELLDSGLASGALTPAEHSWRQGNLPRARSVEDLEALVEDLLTPGPRVSLASVFSRRNFCLGDLGASAEVSVVLGTSTVDLAGLGPGGSLVLELNVVLGEVTVEVPPGIKVRVETDVVLGDFRVDPGLTDPGAQVRITGAVVLGTLRVVTKRLAL